LRRQLAENQRALELHALSLERIVEHRTRELVEANATKDRFLSMVAHELKTPITSLKVGTQLLQRKVKRATIDDMVGQGLEDIERSINRLQRLVNDLLDASLMQSNAFVIHRRRCDLVEICRHILDEYAAGSGSAPRFEASGEAIEAEVDADRIGQVLLNLLSNARKYSPQGCPITVTLQQAGCEVTISVHDRGVGIPPEELEHIFDEYYRVADVEGASGSQSGLGLGLSIANKLVERHAGRIDVRSTPGEGSVFSVVLPMFVDLTTEEVDTAKLAPHTQATWTILQ
jgi:signal transduction histidine kinase